MPRRAPPGVMTPAAMPLWTVRMMFPKMFVRACEIIQTLGAGGLVAVPSYAELARPGGGRRGDLLPGGQRRRARPGSSCSASPSTPRCRRSPGRQQLYERYYSGDPVRLAGTLYALYDRDSYMQRIWDLLDDLETRQFAGPHGPGFRPKRAANSTGLD